MIVLATGLVLYGSTLHPSVAGGDSGELMVTSHELATPHPPGYPTFALSTHIFGHGIHTVMETLGLQSGNLKPAFLQEKQASSSSVGVGVVEGGEEGSNPPPPYQYGGGLAYSMNIYHGCMSAASLVVIYWAVVVSGGSSLGGILAAIMFGFAPNVWTYAIGTEVFPLNNLFSAIILLLAAHFDKLVRSTTSNPSTIARFVHVASFFCGLALTNQHTSVLFVCPIVLWVFFTFPSCWREVRQLTINTVCFFAGIAPYIYIPISNYLNPSPNSWGRSLSVGDFMKHFLRTEYGTFSLASQEATYKESNFGRNTKYFLVDMVHQIGAVLIILAGFAVWKVISSVYVYTQSRSKKPSNTTTFKKQQLAGNKKANIEPTSTKAVESNSTLPSLQIALLLMWTLYVNFFNYFSNLPIEQPLFYGVQQRFWIQPLIITVFMAGHGLTLVQREATAYVSVNHRWVVSAITVVAVGVLVSLQVHTNYTDHNESDNLYVRDYGFALINPLPPGSVVLSKGDIVINAIRFVQNFEEFRRDDMLVLDQEMMTYKWYIDNIKDWIALRGARAAARGCVRSSSSTTTTTPPIPAHCETDRDAIFTKHFGGWKFPGVAYFPGRPNCYTMVDLLRANIKDGRRFFTALGFKEGDPTSNFFYTRNFGLAQEILQSHVVVQQQANPLYQSKDTTTQINKLLKNPQELLLKPSKDGGRTPAPTGDLPSQVVGVIDPKTILDIADTLPEAIYRGAIGDELPPISKKYLNLPPPGRYAPHTWEAVVINDFQQAYFNKGLMFMSISHFMAQYLNEKMGDVLLMKAIIRSVVTSIRSAQEESSSSASTTSSILAVMNQNDDGFRMRVGTYPSFLLAPIFGERFLDMVLTHFNNSRLEYNTIRNMAVINQHLSDIINTLHNTASKAADREVLATFRKALVEEKLVPTFKRLLHFPEHETLTYNQLRDVISYYKRTV